MTRWRWLAREITTPLSQEERESERESLCPFVLLLEHSSAAARGVHRVYIETEEDMLCIVPLLEDAARAQCRLAGALQWAPSIS